MKKAFRSILAGALALLTVSCYDDSALREEISGLDERVTAIEATLSAEVGGINDLLSRIESLEGKIAAIKVETKDGVTTLTLSDNSKVVLAKNGVLTIVDGGWATVAADGTAKIDLSKAGIDFKASADDMGDGIDSGIKAIARSQIKMIDAAIAMLEAVDAMQSISTEIDRNHDK